jgi:hypothetical protein
MTVRHLFLFVCLLLGWLLGGCASTSQVSLTEVRAFADASASLGGYTELSRRYRDTYQREQPYLSASADKLARATDARRNAAYNDFVAAKNRCPVHADAERAGRRGALRPRSPPR